MIQNILAINYKSKTFRYLFVDIIVVALIYFLPSLSHLTSIPFYLFEPMRIGLIFCIVYTSQRNSYLVALTLPLISLIISSHPEIAKSFLITAELGVNVLAFYTISDKLNNKFIVMFLSILIAKSFYYMGKLLFLNLDLLQGDLFSTPLWLQLILMFLFSIYAGVILKNKK